MAELAKSDLTRTLKRRLSWFLSSSPSVLLHLPEHVRAARVEFGSVLERIRARGLECYIFGGALRDLFLKPLAEPARDVDLVVSGASKDQLEEMFSDMPCRRTRFGGLHLQGRWAFDLWALQETWAFRQGWFRPMFEDLPRTAFLNTEALIADVYPTGDRDRQIFEQGFFDAVQQRVVEINFEPNPYPALCVVRSLIIAGQLEFAVGSKLAKYLVEQGCKSSPDELRAVQERHYGFVRLSETDIARALGSIGQQLRSGEQRITLPSSRERQTGLWEWAEPSLVSAASDKDRRLRWAARQRPRRTRDQQLSLYGAESPA